MIRKFSLMLVMTFMYNGIYANDDILTAISICSLVEIRIQFSLIFFVYFYFKKKSVFFLLINWIVMETFFSVLAAHV